MKKLSLVLILTALALPQSGQAGWWRTYGGTGYDVGNCVQVTSDGSYIVSGKSNGYLWILKVDTTGDVIWEKTYGKTEGLVSRWIEETNDGGYIISPRTPSLLRVNAQGDTLWSRDYGIYSYSVQQTKDEGYIVVGGTNGFGFDEKLTLMKSDSNGDTLWSKSFGEPGNIYNSGYFVQVTNDGGYIITGLTEYFDGYVAWDKLWLVKTDSLGNKIWSKIYGDDYTNSRGYSIRQILDGGYIITGLSPNGLWLLKTDANGDTLWTKTYGSPIAGEGYSVSMTLDGGYIISGTTEAVFSNADRRLCLLKTDSQGDTIWTRIYGDQVDGDIGYCVQPTPDKGYIVTGVRNSDLYLLKTDSLGLLSIEESPKKSIPDCGIASSIGSGILLKYQNCTGGLNVSIFDVTGRRMEELKLERNAGIISFGNNYPAGVYIIQVEMKNTTLRKKVVIVH